MTTMPPPPTLPGTGADSLARRRIRLRRGPAPVSRLVSSFDWRRPFTGAALKISSTVVLLLLVAFGAGPIYWMAKATVTPTAELTRDPMRWWPSRTLWGNLNQALTALHIGQYLLNSVLLALGCLVVQLVVSTGAGYALSVLKPRYSRVLYGLFLVTLLVPGTVSLVPLYLTILNVPGFGGSLANTFWAIWLPAGTNAFSILLIKRFFDGIPGELYEAARLDGAGPLTLLRYIVLPMSRPVLAVVSLFAIIASWKDYLWPLIALTDQSKLPLAVALPLIARTSDQGLLIAGLFIASVPPLLLFAFFQRQVVNGVGGDTGSKG